MRGEITEPANGMFAGFFRFDAEAGVARLGRLRDKFLAGRIDPDASVAIAPTVAFDLRIFWTARTSLRIDRILTGAALC